MLSNIILAAGGFALGFLLCGLMVLAWASDAVGELYQEHDEGKQ